jgi:hypothetical protein
MRRAITLVVTVVATSVLFVVPAQADTPGCVSHKEFRRIEVRDTKHHVTLVFDTHGDPVSQHGQREERAYDSCGGAVVFVEYSRHGVTQKSWVKGE